MFDPRIIAIEEIATLDENRDYIFVIRDGINPIRRMKIDEAKEMLHYLQYMYQALKKDN